MAFLKAYFLAQSVMNLLERAVVSPAAEVFPDIFPRGQVMGQVAPFTAGACLIEDGIPDLASVVLGWAAGAPVVGFGQHGLDDCPLFIGEVRGVSSAFHTTRLPTGITFFTRSNRFWKRSDPA